jgi:hypothetical protein
VVCSLSRECPGLSADGAQSRWLCSVPGRTSSGIADSGLYIYDIAAGTWTSTFTPISSSARSNVDGFASSGEDGSQVPISAGPPNVSGGQPSEVVITRTAANGDVILSTSTGRANPTRTVVVVTTTSTGVVVTTDSAGLKGEYRGNFWRGHFAHPYGHNSHLYHQGHVDEHFDWPCITYSTSRR